MKRYVKTLGAAAAISCLMTVPAMAAETRREYKEAAAPVRSEINAVSEQIEEIREANQESAAHFKAERLARKGKGAGSLDMEAWDQAKELRSRIAEIRGRMDPRTKTLRQEAREAAKEENYDLSLQKLDQVLEQKKAALDSLTEIRQLWEEIDALTEQD